MPSTKVEYRRRFCTLMLPTRPNKAETEDDLLRLQNELNETQMSATVSKKSIFAQRMEAARKSKEQGEPVLKKKIESADLLFGQVLSNVQERTLENVVTVPKQMHSTGFPLAVHRSEKPIKNSNLLKDLVDIQLDPEDQAIHQESLSKIANMSMDDIQSALDEITSVLDTESIDFLKKRSQDKYQTKELHLGTRLGQVVKVEE